MDPEALFNLHCKSYHWAEKVAGNDWRRLEHLFRKRFTKLILLECMRALYPRYKEAIAVINSHFQQLKDVT